MTPNQASAALIDLRTNQPRENDLWPVVVATRAEIAAAIDQVADGEPGADGRRELTLAHPSSTEPGLGLAPGIEVLFGLLQPGEETVPRRHNASQLTMVLAGSAETTVGSRSFAATSRDVWNTPSMQLETIRSNGDAPLRYVSYSTAPLLRKLEIYYREMEPADDAEDGAAERSAKAKRAKELAGPAIELGPDGAQLLPYEHLVDPEFVRSDPLLWRWEDLHPHLSEVRVLKQGYTGRRLWVLYNPATGERNGTTPCFFASISSNPPNVEGPSHRHTSAAINFILDGSGWSQVGDQRVEWEAGDIMLSAPGWAPHAHNSGPNGSSVLTVQDHPFQIGAEALVWQERGVVRALGSQSGFETNLAEMSGR